MSSRDKTKYRLEVVRQQCTYVLYESFDQKELRSSEVKLLWSKENHIAYTFSLHCEIIYEDKHL